MRVSAKLVLAGVGLIVLLGGLGAWVVAQDPAPPSGQFDSEIAIRPLEAAAGSYSCEAVLFDHKTAQVLFNPRIVARAGEEGKTTTVLKTGDGTYGFYLAFRVSGQTATYSMEVLRKDQRLFHSMGTVSIGNQP
jgi:hypothetical protein